MVNTPVVARRELNALFMSSTAYVVLTCFALAQGLLFAVALRPPVDPEWILEWVFKLPVYLLMVGAPAVTMGLLSQESSSGTIEALMTAPVTETEVVLGKFTGALIFALALFLPVVAEIGFLAMHGPVDPGIALAGFMGLFLLTAQYMAIGLFCSSLTQMQIGAAIMTFVVLVALYFAGFLAADSGSTVGAFLRYLSPPQHFAGFPQGRVSTKDLGYFFITSGVFLFLTVKSLQLRKWR